MRTTNDEGVPMLDPPSTQNLLMKYEKIDTKRSAGTNKS